MRGRCGHYQPGLTCLDFRAPAGRCRLLLLLPDVQQRGGGGDAGDDHVWGVHYPAVHQAQEGEKGREGDRSRRGPHLEVSEGA